MIKIDYHDRRPIYEQILSGFQKLILTGILKPEEQLPSVRSLAMELSTNPNTVQKAYQELERQGFIYTVKGRGNFVHGSAMLRETRIREILEEMERLFREAVEMGETKEQLFELLKSRIENTKPASD